LVEATSNKFSLHIFVNKRNKAWVHDMETGTVEDTETETGVVVVMEVEEVAMVEVVMVVEVAALEAVERVVSLEVN